MSNTRHVLLALVFVGLGVQAAHAQATYKFVVGNPNGQNVTVSQSPTTNQMTLTQQSADNLSYTFQSTGTSPSAEIYLQYYSCPNNVCGTRKCGFSIAGGSVSADGTTCTTPNIFAYQLQGPGGTSYCLPRAAQAATQNTPCNYTGSFTIQ